MPGEKLEMIAKELYLKHQLTDKKIENECEEYRIHRAYLEGLSEGFYKAYELINSHVFEMRSKEILKLLK